MSSLPGYFGRHRRISFARAATGVVTGLLLAGTMTTGVAVADTGKRSPALRQRRNPGRPMRSPVGP